MPDSTTDLNGTIAEINTQVVGIAPGFAMGNLYQAAAQATSIAVLNCSNAQQNGNTVAEAVATTGAKLITELATK